MAYGKRFRQKTRREYARNHRTRGGNPGLSFSNPQTQKMHFSGLDMYALRLGSFESDAEASALSASVRALGAAGCIIDNGDGSVSVFVTDKLAIRNV